jgi:ligand-binding sensor domain-containing protein
LQQIKEILTNEATKQTALSRIESSITVRNPLTINSSAIKISLETTEARAICQYNDNYYIATPGGLLALDNNGKLLAHYTILDGLPSVDLLTLAVFRSQLYIGTADNGLIAFNGKDFTHYQIQKPIIKQLNVLSASEEKLLIGSFDGGLLSFDGTKFTHRDQEIKPIPQITSLLEHEGRLFVGTYASGLYFWQESRWQQLTKKEGLPSDHVTALIEDKRGTIIATDFGVVLRTTTGEIEQLSKLPNIISLARTGDSLWAGFFTGGLTEILENTSTSNLSSIKKITTNLTTDNLVGDEWKKRSNTKLWVDNRGSLFALTSKGIWQASLDKTRIDFEPFGATAPLAPLTAAHISSIAFDERNRLWIGYFDRGIDIFDPETMQLITHLEDNSIREINFISLDPEVPRMLVATSAGLAVFDSQLQYRMLDEHSELNSNMVAHALTIPNLSDTQLAISTGRGLTLMQGTKTKSPISLPNNYLYTSAFINNHLFLGSLGGLIELEGLRVIKSLTINNSKLSHNWINALLAVNGTLYIGTNGGGIDALTPTGEIVNFSPEIGKFDVNPNALYTDNDFLYVGSLGQGAFILDLKSKTWHKYSLALPSTNVTAITSFNQYVYFGTSNGLLRIDRKVILEK